MIRQKSFKRLVRARMEKTGESYTAGRGMLLGAGEVKRVAKLVLATSGEAIQRRTGRGWEEWFDLLDEWGASDRTHREAARWVAARQDIKRSGCRLGGYMTRSSSSQFASVGCPAP
jgi:hypothetical protein